MNLHTIMIAFIVRVVILFWEFSVMSCAIKQQCSIKLALRKHDLYYFVFAKMFCCIVLCTFLEHAIKEHYA